MVLFWKDIKIIKWCSNCKVRYEPNRYSWQNKRNICVKCVSKELALWRKKNSKKWAKIVSKYRKKPRSVRLLWQIRAYERWKEWVAKNPEKRKKIALNSYHRRKNIRP